MTATWEPMFDGVAWCVVWEDSELVPMITHFPDEAVCRRFCAATSVFLAGQSGRLKLVENALKRGVAAADIADLIESIEARPHNVGWHPPLASVHISRAL